MSVLQLIINMAKEIQKYKKAYIEAKEENDELKGILEESNILFVSRKEALYG